MAKYTIDRIVNGVAVLLLRENEEKQIDVKKEILPSHAQEGDILEIEFSPSGEINNIQVLTDETDQAKKRAEDLIQKLLNKENK